MTALGPVMGYRMTADTGFAPNPFHGHLTLATCKPALRRARKHGDWIAGFASKQLVQTAAAMGVRIEYMALIYLAEITEKPLPLGEYFQDPRFARKKPNTASSSPLARCGDNIYSAEGNGGFRWWPNDHHGVDAMSHDTDGRNALISSRFWYFGRKAFAPEDGWEKLIAEPISGARTFRCPQPFLPKVLDRLSELGIRPGVHADPCVWNDARTGGCSVPVGTREIQARGNDCASPRRASG